jgi:hypothetical protein
MGMAARYKALTTILICVPAAVLAVLIARYGVDVPFWDQFFPVGLSASAHRGQFNIHNLWLQRNESRSFFPYLLFILIDFLAQGNVKYEMFAMLVVAALVLWNVYRLAGMTMAPGWGRSVAIVLSSLLIFSPVQWQNWLWGIQLICFMPIACLTSAIVVCYSKLEAWIKLCVSAALATVATYSFANGMICWVVLLGVVLAQFRTALGRVMASLAWAAFAGASLSAYFYRYRWLPNTSGLRDLPGFAVKAVRCFLAFLGAPLGLGKGLGDLNLAIRVGLLVLILMCLTALQLVRRRREQGIWSNSAPWLTLAAYSLCSATLTTIGRGRDTQIFLLDSRYTTFSLYAIVALIFLLPIAYAKSGSRQLGTLLGLALTALFLVLHTRNFWYAVIEMRELRVERLQAKACLAFTNVITSSCQTERLDPDPIELKQVAWAIAQVGFAHPALASSPDPLSLSVSPDMPSRYGAFESLTKIKSGWYRAYGYAILPERSEPADGVLLSYRLDGHRTLFAIADRTDDRSDIASSLGRREYKNSGWEQWIKVPAGADLIEAWAYDALTGQLFPLAGPRRVDQSPVENIDFTAGNGGSFEYAASGDPTIAGGWAVLPDHRSPADRVLLTCGSGDPIVATVGPYLPRPDIGKPFYDFSVKPGWRVSIPRARMPPPGCEMKAWSWGRQTHAAAISIPIRTIAPAAIHLAPLGSIDIPAPNSTVTGVVTFGGWVLSSAGNSKVDLWREPKPGEAGRSNGLILLGTAASAGARPDVEALYPNYPDSASAGWGYRLHSNELGNGSFRIHTIAHDLAGNSIDLGVRTIIVKN